MSRDGATKLQAVKGMNDVLPPDSAKWARVETRAKAVFESYGYREVRTPIAEYTPLFVRSIGEATDVVEKEMYTFEDRDERSLTLRPEGTAGVVRAFLEHAVHQKEPVSRWYYAGPMFRHERAQRGRYRQFYQLGVEAFGVAEPTIDAEQVAMLRALFVDLGIPSIEVVVNSVGGPDDRPRFRAALAAYLSPRAAELCPDCVARLARNPLRVLDCKVEGCRAVVALAPSILDHLGEPARAHFDRFLATLTALGVPHEVEPRLVRGLDYYTGTTFELRSLGGDLGAQNTLGGGGRYDRLVEELGGPSTPAVGFACGTERMVLAMPGEAETFEPVPDAFFCSHGDRARLAALATAATLRARGLRVEVDHRAASLKAQMKRADRVHARMTVIVGEEELASGRLTVRDMATGEQRQLTEAELAGELGTRATLTQ